MTLHQFQIKLENLHKNIERCHHEPDQTWATGRDAFEKQLQETQREYEALLNQSVGQWVRTPAGRGQVTRWTGLVLEVTFPDKQNGMYSYFPHQITF
jgi:hypothetical protein